jgi:hypothetical protein
MNSSITSKDTGKHSNALFGESVRQVLLMLAPL